jgi:hypothetical protein
MQRFTSASPHDLASPFLLALILLVAIAATAAGCGDSEPGNNTDGGLDAALDGDADINPQDAWVDNGPLDCGVRPADGSVCVTGRLYDFQTDEPITPGVENSLFSFYDGQDMPNVKYNPDTFMGRLDPNGRFFVWTNDWLNDTCLALLNPVDGYLPATINCYSDNIALHPDYPGEHRYYLIPTPLLTMWQEAYPGGAELTVDRPIFLGQCRDANWEPIDSGEYTFYSNASAFIWDRECYPLTENRTSYVDANDTTGDIQPGGAFIYFIPLEYNGNTLEVLDSVRLTCRDVHSGPFSISYVEIDAGEIEFVIFNNLPFR